MAPPTHPWLADLARSVASIEPMAVALTGGWSSQTRKVYRDATQLGTGAGPFVDVIDRAWRGTVDCVEPIVGIALCGIASEVHWVKSSPASATLGLSLTASGYADFLTDSFTVALGLGGSHAPGLPITMADPTAALGDPSGVGVTARPITLLRVGDVELAILLLPGRLVTVGRNRLWRLRERELSGITEPARSLLAGRRSGRLDLARTSLP